MNPKDRALTRLRFASLFHVLPGCSSGGSPPLAIAGEPCKIDSDCARDLACGVDKAGKPVCVEK
jgi:hypothetical protein